MIDDSQEEDPHKKSDLFDTSKDKIGKEKAISDLKYPNLDVQKGVESDEDDFDLGFGSNKKGKEKLDKKNDHEAELAGMGSDEGESMTEEQQHKAIEE